MPIPRVYRFILLIALIVFAALSLRYLTVRMSTTGQHLCVQYNTAYYDAGNYYSHFTAVDASTGAILRTNRRPFVQVITTPDRTQARVSPDSQWIAWTAKLPSEKVEGDLAVWVSPFRFGDAQHSKAINVLVSLGVSAIGLHWSPDSSALVIDIRRDDPERYLLIGAQRDADHQWTTHTIADDSLVPSTRFGEWSADGKYLLTGTISGTPLLHQRWDAATFTLVNAIETEEYLNTSLSPNGRYLLFSSWGKMPFTLTLIDFDSGERWTYPVSHSEQIRNTSWSANSKWVAVETWSGESNGLWLHIIGKDGTKRLDVIKRPPRLGQLNTDSTYSVWSKQSGEFIYDSGDVSVQRLIAYDPLHDTHRIVIERAGWHEWSVIEDESGGQQFSFSPIREQSRKDGQPQYALLDGSTGKSLVGNVTAESLAFTNRFVATGVERRTLDTASDRWNALVVIDTVTGALKTYDVFDSIPFDRVHALLLERNSTYFFFTASLTAESADPVAGGRIALYRLDPATGSIEQIIPPSDDVRPTYLPDSALWDNRIQYQFTVYRQRGDRTNALTFDMHGNKTKDFDYEEVVKGWGYVQTFTADPTDTGVPYIVIYRYASTSTSDPAAYIVHNSGAIYPIRSPHPTYNQSGNIQILPADDLIAVEFVRPDSSGGIDTITTIVDRFGVVKYSFPMYISPNQPQSAYTQWASCRNTLRFTP